MFWESEKLIECYSLWEFEYGLLVDVVLGLDGGNVMLV